MSDQNKQGTLEQLDCSEVRTFKTKEFGDAFVRSNSTGIARGNEAYQCDDCGDFHLRTTTPAALKACDHLYRHLGADRYSCGLCHHQTNDLNIARTVSVTDRIAKYLEEAKLLDIFDFERRISVEQAIQRLILDEPNHWLSTRPAPRPAPAEGEEFMKRQFIGVTDRDGTPIHEGHILWDGVAPGRVRWLQEECAFVVYSKKPTPAYHRIESDGQLRKSVIIGTYDDSPEMMEDDYEYRA